MSKIPKALFILLGWISLLIAIIGIFLPLLPTTPLVILAGYFFSKGSQRLHVWLRNQRTFGPMIIAWEDYGVIKPKAKALATVMIITLFSYTLIFVQVNIIIKSIIATIGASVLYFILSRPSAPK